MWDVVERCTADGTLDALRDGKLATSIAAGNRKHHGPEKTGSKRVRKNDRAGSKAAKAQEQQDESDGGFFEE